MAESELTHKDRSYAATAGVSGTPFDTPTKSQSPRNSDAGTNSNVSVKLPLASYCIIVVEGCERFCFYGLRAILLLYFMQFLSLNKDDATVGYHLFSFACYFTPIIGAIISDGFIGRYWTILVFAIVYFLGDIVLTVTAVPSIGRMALTGPIIGLLFIALGTGGIKPCVGPFGAEQISNANTKQISRYFAIYYFSINVGSFVSTLVTPSVRSNVQCFDYNCYSLAFGIPTILMLIAIIIFVVGTPLYRRVPPKENIIARFIAIIWRAIRNAICGPRSQRKEGCLSYADDKYGNDDIEDVRAVLRVFVIFVPLPIYFALYNQSGSRWTYQASLMNGNFGALGMIQPDQMQALNSLFILLFIPLFEEVIYPLCARCNFLVKPLPRMFAGMIVMLVAFLVAAAVQAAIQGKSNTIVVRTHTNIFNAYSCGIHVNHDNRTIQSGQTIQYPCTTLLEQGLLITSTCTNADTAFKLSSDQLCPSILILSEAIDNKLQKTIELTALSNTVANQQGAHAAALLRVVSLDGQENIVRTVPNNIEYRIEKKLVPTEYKSVLPAAYQIEIQASGEQSIEKFRVYTTGIYTALLYKKNNTEFHATLFEDVPPYTIHILWQTIQYVLMTVAEILVSITGLMFAYSQAPKRYKTVIMSAWLLTSAFGDLIVVLIAEVRLVKNQALEFLLFALFMAIAAFIFGLFAMRYKEYQPTHDDTEDQQLILEKTSPEIEQIIQ